jgi:ATP-dependent DNA helicase DinG
MRSPRNLGLPPKFERWRPNQLKATLEVAASEGGFFGLNAPTGSGKSAIYMAASRLLEARTVVLTSTRGLQDQLVREFPFTTDIRGQNNYLCELERPAQIQVDRAICHLGVPCHLKGGGCTYFDAYRRAIAAPTVVTNYSYWLSVHQYAEGLGGFDFMVCDEAHNALDEVGGHLSVHVSDRDRDAFLDRSEPWDNTKREWKAWAIRQAHSLNPSLQVESEQLKQNPHNRSLMRRVHDMKSVMTKLQSVIDLSGGSEKWVYELSRGSLIWTPVWPGRYSAALFQGIRRVLLVSATLTPKAMQMLGLQGFEYQEYPSTFPVRRRPVLHLRSGVRLKHDTDKLSLKAWVAKIDQFIEFRLGRKGLIHTVSYARRDYLLHNSRHRAHFVTHESGDVGRRVAEFKSMRAPAILVSPSILTGFDFPGDEARWQVITKVPFPDSRSPVYAERHKDDKEYGAYLAMVALVQAAGRGNRSEDDWCETVIVDDNIEWFMHKFRKFAPRYFLDAYRGGVMITPPPLEV